MVTYNIFKKMKIGVRVSIGFLIILGIFIATSLFSLNIFSESKKSFFNLSKVSSEAVAILDIDRQVSELQRVILAYSNTGSKGLITRAKKSHSTLTNNLSLFKISTDDKDNLNLLKRMTKTLVSFGEHIDALIEAKDQRDFLLNESMASLVSNQSILIKELLNSAKNSNDKSTLEKFV